MSGGPTPEDPFAEGDPEAAEREARRREREARRRAQTDRERDERNRRSLAARVSGARGEPAAAGEQPAPPAHGGERPEPAAHGGPPTDRAIVMRRRLLGGGLVLGALAALFLLIKAVGGGEEPTPVATTEPAKTIDVLVPEGLTIEQMADVAKKAKLKGSYEKAVEQAQKRFPLKRYDAEDAPTLEGFLFPATYELEKGARAEDLVAKQLEAFEQNFSSVNLKQARKKNLTAYDVLTIASLIEKEIQVAEERPLAAAVIYNRLSAGDTLGIDATLRYELGNYDEQLLQSELDAATPYNTRVTPGLPPTPIASPGLASIEAAADPADSDVYYFVVKPGTCGEHVFTADKAKFDEAEAAYQQALAEEGGSPTDCG